MTTNTKIEWADHTFNPWIGCQKVGPGCDHCYAEAWDRRFAVSGHAMRWGAHAKRTRTKTWGEPKKWDKAHAEFFAQHGRRQRVFCASLADVFDNQVDPQWRADLLRLIDQTPNLDWLLLTKRIGNAAAMLDQAEMIACGSIWINYRPRPNIWLGATVVNQKEADRDIPKLLTTPARVRFLSMEPLLGPVNLHLNLTTVEERLRVQRELVRTPGEFQRLSTRGELLHWVIAGGESGPGARPSHPDWYSNLRDQCAAAGVPFLFKQWGEWFPINQQQEEFTNRLYKSNRVAKLHEDQGVLDDCYGRTCTVAHTVIHMDGSTHAITEPMAFLQNTGAMTTFKVGKKSAGRVLDGREWNGVPA